MAKYDRRKERDSAIGDLNGLAEEAGLDKVGYRAGAEAVADRYVRLGRSLSLARARSLSLALARSRSRSLSLALARARSRDARAQLRRTAPTCCLYQTPPYNTKYSPAPRSLFSITIADRGV